MSTLNGLVPIEINFVPAQTCRDVKVDSSRTQKIHKFSNGKRGRSQGQPEYKFSLTFSTTKEASEFRQLADLGIDAEDDDGGFTLSYEKGGEKYMLLNCGLDSDGISSDQDGTADQVVTGVATDRKRLR